MHKSLKILRFSSNLFWFSTFIPILATLVEFYSILLNRELIPLFLFSRVVIISLVALLLQGVFIRENAMNSHGTDLTYEELASMLPSGASPELSQAIYTIVEKNIARGRFKRFLKSNTEISLLDYVLRVHQSHEVNYLLVKDIQIEKNKDAWRSFSETVHSWAYRFLDRWELARESQISYTQDIAQKASIAILEAYFPYDCDFYAWSCVLVHNIGSTFMRDMQKTSSFINEDIGDLSEIEEWVTHSSSTHVNSVDLQKIDVEDILEATQKLSPTQASLIKKYYWEGKSFTEIASEEQVSINTIYKRHFDALARLRKILRDIDINE